MNLQRLAKASIKHPYLSGVMLSITFVVLTLSKILLSRLQKTKEPAHDHLAASYFGG